MNMICGRCNSTSVDFLKVVFDNEDGFIETICCYDCGHTREKV